MIQTKLQQCSFSFCRLLYGLALVFFFQSASAQLTDFTLNVTKTDETCPGNGTLSFSITGQTAGSTVVYKIYHLPDAVNPIATLSGNTFGGLVAGNYRVVAIQALGDETNSEQSDVTILDNTVQLMYTVTIDDTTCGPDGKITVNVTQGTAVSYEIFAGPVIRPLQPSNVFDLLPAGVYQVRVFDNCGDGVVLTCTVASTSSDFTIDPSHAYALASCNIVIVLSGVHSTPGHIISYPLTFQYVVHPPSGPDIIVNFTEPIGNATGAGFFHNLPFFYDQLYTFDLTITDGCGNTHTLNGNEINERLEVAIDQELVGCGKNLVVSPLFGVSPFTVTFLSAPAGFNPLSFNGQHPGPFIGAAVYYNDSFPLPTGNYVIQIADSCGHTAQTTTYYEPGGVAALIQVLYPGCDEDEGAVRLLNPVGTFDSVAISSAPASYTQPLPHDVSQYIWPDISNFSISGLPPGEYVFTTTDNCGNPLLTPVTIQGFSIVPDLIVNRACNSFGLQMEYEINLNNIEWFYLQRWNPSTGQWVHPDTGVPQTTIPGPGNATQMPYLSFNEIYLNNQTATGLFRIVIVFPTVGNGNQPVQSCFKEVAQFEYYSEPHIIGIYPFACASGVSDVVVDAIGVPPLTYHITTKDGQPFLVNNGTSSMFTGLEPAIYNFQVHDNCGNILNQFFDISNPVSLTISSINLCQGQSGSLVMPDFDFLNYQWWKGDNPGNILSTTNELSFASFDNVADAGEYHVLITYPFTNSCIDQTLDFTVTPGGNAPEAGTGSTVAYCGGQGAIDLFSLLTGPFDNSGQWYLSPSTSPLASSSWNSDVASGTYNFIYRVEGFCNLSDESTVTITINAAPETPIASVEQDVCDGQPVQLMATTVPSATYTWTGPNGFTSNEQNPIISNPTMANTGTYSVSVIANGCESGISSVEIEVLETPQFTVEAGCVGNNYVLEAIPDQSPIPENTIFSWTGPDGYSATGNPQVITGLPAGIYEVAISWPNTCVFTGQVEVEGTLCGIPKGVSPNNDGDNDVWDLSGFDIENVQIFNRYGMEVYEKAHYVNQWHGQDKKGHMLPGATYYYLVKLASGETKSGWVYLLRKS